MILCLKLLQYFVYLLEEVDFSTPQVRRQMSFGSGHKQCCQSFAPPKVAYFRLLGMIGMMGTIRHDIMPNGFCMWHDGGMTGSMTVRLSCHSQADT